MNVNNFYRDVFEDVLGLDVLGLESRYKDLVELINRKTLLAFGNYIPCIYKANLDLSDPNVIVRKDYSRVGKEYYIDDPVIDKFNLPILGVNDIVFENGSLTDPESDNYYSSVITSRQTMGLDSILMGAETTYSKSLVDTAIPFKKDFEYRGNRVIYIRNFPYNGRIEIDLNTTFPNIASIPEEYREAFTQLAILDVKTKLYNELKYIEDIVTPAGNLNLKISDWDSAANDRKEYIRDLRTRSLPDRVINQYFHVL